ncbi:hypothetical protein GCM10012289_33470 [Nonomuraea cavernae]|uniref:Uncharacterized protein n=1 Tax=Nonomuraea cavernae TaxID=2045107 RepID=A0A917Z1E7_9ACTN|nr:hypothetical protein GCM10012289_33470 [Nonomuraea cavernae]
MGLGASREPGPTVGIGRSVAAILPILARNAGQAKETSRRAAPSPLTKGAPPNAETWIQVQLSTRLRQA